MQSTDITLVSLGSEVEANVISASAELFSPRGILTNSKVLTVELDL